jgi:hypothetical protein
MLPVASALKGYTIEAEDGDIGTVNDFLFDDMTWNIKWLVVDTGNWLPGRKVLISPSAIGTVDYGQRFLHVKLTKGQVKRSPDIGEDEPVSRQMEGNLYRYYGWDPAYGGSYFGATSNAMASAFSPPPFVGAGVTGNVIDPEHEKGDPTLRSIAAVTGYHIKASDGEIGHVENFLVNDADWSIRYLIVDTKNWWPGKHVLISPFAVREISWPDRQISLDIRRDKVKGSPPWEPIDAIDETYERRIHDHYGWPGYGW